MTGTAAALRGIVRLAASSLDCTQAAVSAGLGEELIAAEVRVALNELGKVAGAVYTDDVSRPHLQPLLHREVAYDGFCGSLCSGG